MITNYRAAVSLENDYLDVIRITHFRTNLQKCGTSFYVVNGQ